MGNWNKAGYFKANDFTDVVHSTAPPKAGSAQLREIPRREKAAAEGPE